VTTLHPITRDEAPTLRNLFELYAHDFSEIARRAGWARAWKTEQFRRNWEARFEAMDSLLEEMKSEEKSRSRRH